jgi:hypothetical protein
LAAAVWPGFVAGVAPVFGAGACEVFAAAVLFEFEPDAPCCAPAFPAAKMLTTPKITAILIVFFIDRHFRTAHLNPQIAVRRKALML